MKVHFIIEQIKRDQYGQRPKRKEIKKKMDKHNILRNNTQVTSII